jgi:hypothetical protein
MPWLILPCVFAFGCRPPTGVGKDGEAPDDTVPSDDTVHDDSDDSESGETGLPDPDPIVDEDVRVEPYVLEAGGTATVFYGGRFKAHPPLTLQYAFNGWNHVDGVDGLIERGGEHGNHDFYVEVPMTPDGALHTATVVLPEQARSFHFCVFYEEEEPVDSGDTGEPTLVRHMDCRGGLEYHREIVFPYIGPYLTWDDETRPEDGVVINFETGVQCRARVEWGETPDLGQERYGDEVVNIHHLRLTDLAPGTTYYYRVHDNVGHTSGIYQFRTALADATTFSFLALGDIQDDGEDSVFGAVAAELLTTHADVDFLVSTGDLPDFNSPNQWWRFFDLVRDILSTRVLVPAPGNHDTPGPMHSSDTSAWEAYFALPEASGSETFYRRDYGNLTFLIMNSEVPEDLVEGGRQWSWLSTQIEEIGRGPERTRDWVLLVQHVPPYNAGSRHASEQPVYRPITRLLEGSVDWMVAGHEHMYQRSLPLRYDETLAPSGRYGLSLDDGVGYLVLPSAGKRPHSGLTPVDAPWAASRALMAYPEIRPEDSSVPSEVGYVRFRVDARSMSVETWGLGDGGAPAHVRDSLHLSK